MYSVNRNTVSSLAVSTMKIILYLCILLLAPLAMAEQNLQEMLTEANDQFTTKMFHEVVKDNAKKSCVLSAFSVLSPLAQLALASVGESHDEILQAIGMPNDKVTKKVFSDANERIRSINGVVVIQANKLYVNRKYTLNDDFAAVSKDVFKSEVQKIDFSEAKDAAKEINKWVEDHTNERIKKLVSHSSITSSTSAILVNAIYFKGNWRNPFSTRNTKERSFYTNKKDTVKKPMMQETTYFDYGESKQLDAKFLEMKYEGKETSFVVVLPNEYNGVNALVEKLKDPAAFKKGRKAMFNAKVHVSLPKFKIETTTNLKEILPKINIKGLFSASTAHIDNLIKGHNHMYITEAIQKTFIEVNEEGTEAAAANAFIAGLSSSNVKEEIKTFNANHPFVFYLMHKDDILFNGVFRS